MRMSCSVTVFIVNEIQKYLKIYNSYLNINIIYVFQACKFFFFKFFYSGVLEKGVFLFIYFF